MHFLHVFLVDEIGKTPMLDSLSTVVYEKAYLKSKLMTEDAEKGFLMSKWAVTKHQNHMITANSIKKLKT